MCPGHQEPATVIEGNDKYNKHAEHVETGPWFKQLDCKKERAEFLKTHSNKLTVLAIVHDESDYTIRKVVEPKFSDVAFAHDETEDATLHAQHGNVYFRFYKDKNLIATISGEDDAVLEKAIREHK